MSGNSAQWPVFLGLDHTLLCESDRARPFSAEAEKLRISGLCSWSDPEKMQPREGKSLFQGNTENTWHS